MDAETEKITLSPSENTKQKKIVFLSPWGLRFIGHFNQTSGRVTGDPFQMDNNIFTTCSTHFVCRWMSYLKLEKKIHWYQLLLDIDLPVFPSLCRLWRTMSTLTCPIQLSFFTIYTLSALCAYYYMKIGESESLKMRLTLNGGKGGSAWIQNCIGKKNFCPKVTTNQLSSLVTMPNTWALLHIWKYHHSLALS